jgi:hypothetical protein
MARGARAREPERRGTRSCGIEPHGAATSGNPEPRSRCLFLLASTPSLGAPVSADTRDCLAAVWLVFFRDHLLFSTPQTHRVRQGALRATFVAYPPCPGATPSKVRAGAGRAAQARGGRRRRGEGARAQRSRQKYRKPSGPQRSGGQRRGPAGVPKHPAAKLGAARKGVIWPCLIPTSAIHCPLCRGQAGAPRANTRRGTVRRERGARAGLARGSRGRTCFAPLRACSGAGS